MDILSNTDNNTSLSAANFLAPEQLTVSIPANTFTFSQTAELLPAHDDAQLNPAWLLQAEAKQAAAFGLGIQAQGFNVLALGEVGTGRTTLMLNVIQAMACENTHLQDVVALNQFDANGQSILVKLPAGHAVVFKEALDRFILQLIQMLGGVLDGKVDVSAIEPIKKMVESKLLDMQSSDQFINHAAIKKHLFVLQKDLLDYLNAWQPSNSSDGDSHLEAILSEGFIGRYRVNVLVSNRPSAVKPTVVDYDPSLHSLFGGIDSTGEANSTPEFMRLRAGRLLQADGGVLLLNLRDILADEVNGPQLLEKLHRFCRNGKLLIEDLSGGQSASLVGTQTPIDVDVKIVLIATREDYYALLEDNADFFSFFPIKVEFSENVKASQAYYDVFALLVAQKCHAINAQHFTAEAVIGLLQAMHRQEEDQTRLSTTLALLDKLIVESIAVATLEKSTLVEINHVKAALARRYQRHRYIEGQIRESIVDQELMINVHGVAIGQVNALTHIDLADASFGSPVRISANCYAGARGVVNIDREVTMSGPTHDKGLMIMQSWLQQHFSQFNPLNFTASLVFEQEYSGVDGDSASCAELFALISSLTQLPINQSVAVTGAMNQHGEVLPVGGLNEKIEGYFRVCQDIGLSGKQGVLIPAKNMRHLVLNDAVIAAVEAGQFHIATMSRVEEGLMYLMQEFMESINQHAATRLQAFKEIIVRNKPTRNHKN